MRGELLVDGNGRSELFNDQIRVSLMKKSYALACSVVLVNVPRCPDMEECSFKDVSQKARSLKPSPPPSNFGQVPLNRSRSIKPVSTTHFLEEDVVRHPSKSLTT